MKTPPYPNAHDLAVVDDGSISRNLPERSILIDPSRSIPFTEIREEARTYGSLKEQSHQPIPANDLDLAGALAALRRASAKAIAQVRSAGLEPVTRKTPEEEPNVTKIPNS